MTSFIERKVNEICGRWLDGFTKDNVDVSLLQAKITLSDLHFKTDELCLLSPTFAPSFFYVGKLSIDIPLAWDLSRPVKIMVTDVLGVVRVRDHHESMTAEGVRKSISANVHVKAILSKLADELGGGAAEEGKHAARINLHTVHNIHKIMRNLEVTVKNAHVRVEEPAREVPVPADEPQTETEIENETDAATGRRPSTPAVAFGICLRGISLGLDERADAGAGGGSGGERWFGKKFRAMETALLGNFSRYDAVDGAIGRLRNDAESDGDGDVDAHTDTPSDADISDGARSDTAKDSSTDGSASDDSKSSSSMAITKFASVRGASVYFCRDEECYSATDREETLRRLREDLRSPPTALPPLLRRCRAGVGIRLVFSAREWGKMESLDVRLLAGDINVQLGDDHLGYLLRWTSLLKDSTRALALSALRPEQKSIPPSQSTDGDGDGGGLSKKSRYYRALWRHAVEVVLRDLRSSVWQRGEKARKELQLAQAARSESIDRAWSIEESEYRTTRGLLWRTWFTEWVQAARYLGVRQLIHSRLVVESFADESGGIHSRLYEDLEVQPKPAIPTARAGAKGRGGRGRSSSRLPSGRQRGATERRLAKYLMPWQLPHDDVRKAWILIYRNTLRWELRYAGGIKLAIDEERVDQRQLDPAMLQALWSIQLQLDAQLPHRICAFSRRMAFLRVAWRSRIDRLWQARAEKQRRLGLGLGLEDPPNPPRLTANDSISFTASEMGFAISDEFDYENAADELFDTLDGGDGADRVGTLLVRMGQLDGVGGAGVLSLAPKAVATLMLEESSATLEEMDLETNFTEVAKYDHKNERCCWNQTFRLEVELNEDYVQDLRRERMKKHGRTLTGSSAADLFNSSISSIGSSNTSPMKSHGAPSSGSRMKTKDTMSSSLIGSDHSTSPAKSPGAMPMTPSTARDREREREMEGEHVREMHRRTDSTDSTRFQMTEAVPLSSFLLAVSCIDKSVFGVSQLDSMTLPGKQLTAVPLKVLEHRCALFSPAAVDQQPRELTLETIFVPPGEDVALAERELSAIGRQRHLQEKLKLDKDKGDKGKSSPSSSGRKSNTKPNKKSSGGRVGALEASSSPSTSSRPSRPSLDNVGEREVKILSLEPSEGAAVVGGSGDAGDEESPAAGDEDSVSSAQGSIPIVNTETPRKVAMSMRAAGVTVVTYLSRGEGKTNGQGEREAQQDTRLQDVVVTLSETSAREIEACSEMDIVRGKFSLALEAATLQLVDKSLLQVASLSASAASTSPVREKRSQKATPRPQLFMVGPVGVEVASMRFARKETETNSISTRRPRGERSGCGAVQEAPVTPTPPTRGALQNPSYGYGRVNTDKTADGRDRQFWDALGSWPTWDWRGCLKIGAYTAEVGKSHGRPGLEEVWRQFRFSMPKSALEDTQVLRGGTANSSGAAKSSTWLLKAGEKGLAVDVQMPTHEHIEVSRAPSPKSYVYVSSSESESCSPPFSPSSSAPSPSPSPVANGDGYGITSSRTPSRLSQAASIYFPKNEEKEERTGSISNSPWPSSKSVPLFGEGASAFDGSTAKMREDDFNAAPNTEQLVRRVHELERELEALKDASTSASAVVEVAKEVVR
eukprot:g1699.t2